MHCAYYRNFRNELISVLLQAKFQGLLRRTSKFKLYINMSNKILTLDEICMKITIPTKDVNELRNERKIRYRGWYFPYGEKRKKI